jgi:hypothetical protein
MKVRPGAYPGVKNKRKISKKSVEAENLVT